MRANASMRPPHYTGENLLAAWQRLAALRCFNEAPALHGGKRRCRTAARAASRASMRPPHYTGENGVGRLPWSPSPRFNEAPALHGGKHLPVLLPVFHEVASMRPPHYTGENA